MTYQIVKKNLKPCLKDSVVIAFDLFTKLITLYTLFDYNIYIIDIRIDDICQSFFDFIIQNKLVFWFSKSL